MKRGPQLTGNEAAKTLQHPPKELRSSASLGGSLANPAQRLQGRTYLYEVTIENTDEAYRFPSELGKLSHVSSQLIASAPRGQDVPRPVAHAHPSTRRTVLLQAQMSQATACVAYDT